MAWLFGAFIVACGTTHFLGYYTFHEPIYRLDGLIKAITAFVSWATVIALIPVTPRALAMRSPLELEREIASRKEAETALQRAHDDLEVRVRKRTEELATANKKLQEEIAEHRRLEEQLLQAQKLESVGRLAGGVAHDFNNLLTVILVSAELMGTDPALNTPAQEYLRNITQAGQRASNLTKQLLTFARRQVIEPKTINLNDLTVRLDKMLRRLIGANIELVLMLEESLRSVKVDPGQFEQILVNLIVNARDAMPEGGKITIETRNVTLDAESARPYKDLSPGEYVMLAIRDTGEGMEEEIRAHIFEPFFTTKEQGKGTGLGLATVYGIVKQAGGHIDLSSEPGRGTTFQIYLPCTLEAISVESAPPLPTAPLDGSETILLVEDEAAVRALSVQTLRRRGYTVLEAMNGEEALRVVQGREKEIVLLVTDMIMPQMNGKELAQRLLALHPHLKVLYASGYTENTIMHEGVLEPGVDFLAKPFTPTQLAGKVREILDQQAASPDAP